MRSEEIPPGSPSCDEARPSPSSNRCITALAPKSGRSCTGDDIAIAAVTVAELRAGALLASPRRTVARTAYVDDIIATIPVIDYDAEVAEAHTELLVEVRSQGRPRGAHDLIIAATARAFARTIVSADRTAFLDLSGVEVRSHR